MSTYAVFVNFLEDGNRYRAEIFRVYITFNGVSNDVSFVFVPQNFVITTCLSYVDRVFVFLRNRVLRLRQKYPLANFHVKLFSRLRVSIPGRYPRRSILLFQASRHGQFLHIAFAHDVNIDSGTLVNREPQHTMTMQAQP